jgi:hypothetical protein
MFGSCSKNKIFYCPHAYNTRIPAIYYLHSKGFSPAQDPDFEAMAAWWSGKADGKTIFYKMHEHLENNYKKWTGKKRENENMMNSLNKRQKKSGENSGTKLCCRGS